MRTHAAIPAAVLSLGLCLWLLPARAPAAPPDAAPAASPLAAAQPVAAQPAPAAPFPASDVCMACHNGMLAPDGQDVSVGTAWRGSVMAHAARDPYWQAAVRRETLDHPAAAAAIEGECSRCHMPQATSTALAEGAQGQVFVHLPVGPTRATPQALLAADGVACGACHQQRPEKLGAPETFSGHFLTGGADARGAWPMYGPYEVDAGRASVMRSATGFTPAKGDHARAAELCAACHTLFTDALGPDGKSLGRLPEQVPYLEWLQSDHKDGRTCQECHLPAFGQSVPVSSVLGQPRADALAHRFRGGNAFLLSMLGLFRDELGVAASAAELEAERRASLQQLQARSAKLEVTAQRGADGALSAAVAVTNLAGHKLPTAYPSRRAWLHLAVRDAAGKVVFESGAVQKSGAIEGNDNDADPARFEPHYAEITRVDQVQIYEPVLGSHDGKVTTALLGATRYLKDNRLLPQGFDKAAAPADVQVQGEAAQDPDFEGGSDRVVYRVPAPAAPGPLTVEVELLYQSIGFRWAKNLAAVDAAEPRRFGRYFDALAGGSAVSLARASAAVP